MDLLNFFICLGINGYCNCIARNNIIYRTNEHPRTQRTRTKATVGMLEGEAFSSSYVFMSPRELFQMVSKFATSTYIAMLHFVFKASINFGLITDI